MTDPRPRLGLGLLFSTLALALGCGASDPDDLFTVEASFTSSPAGDVCTFVFQADASDPAVPVRYSYELRAMSLIAPDTWQPTLPLENDLSSFTGQLRLSWDVSIATLSIVGRFINYRLSTSDGFEEEKSIEVFCPE